MDERLQARLAIARLHLPIPGSKWALSRAIANLLHDETVNAAVWDELLQSLSLADTEFDVVELLAIAVMASDSKIVDRGALQSAIRKPSALSDKMLLLVSAVPLLIDAWSKCHSGEVLSVFVGDAQLGELTSGRLIPPILPKCLLTLEKISGKPFMKQWAFEYQTLLDRLDQFPEGHWEYFIGDADRENASGQFITRRGKVARSAYLRTLALAFDRWKMPRDVAYEYAIFASPIDPCFVRSLPGPIPNWAASLRDEAPTDPQGLLDLAQRILSHAYCGALSQTLLHLNIGLAATNDYQSEIEIVTFLQEEATIPPEELFHFHDLCPGDTKLERSDSGSLISRPHFVNASLSARNGAKFRPALLPAVPDYAGYFHADLWHRMPYIPANFSDTGSPIYARPRIGGLELEFEGSPCGELAIWNDRWSPVHHREMGSGFGIALALNSESLNNLLSVPSLRPRRFLRATVMRRDRSYSPWKVDKFAEILDWI